MAGQRCHKHKSRSTTKAHYLVLIAICSGLVQGCAVHLKYILSTNKTIDCQRASCPRSGELQGVKPYFVPREPQCLLFVPVFLDLCLMESFEFFRVTSVTLSRLGIITTGNDLLRITEARCVRPHLRELIGREGDSIGDSWKICTVQ